MIKYQGIEYYGVWEVPEVKGVYCTLYSPGTVTPVPENFREAPASWFQRDKDYEFWVDAKEVEKCM